MPISPEDFLTTAKKLSESELESCHRSAASRAYYAVYHQAKFYADSKAFPSLVHVATGDHSRLVLRYEDDGKSNNNIKSKSIAISLKTLKDNRKRADYELDRDFDTGIMKVQIATAEKMLNDRLK